MFNKEWYFPKSTQYMCLNLTRNQNWAMKLDYETDDLSGWESDFWFLPPSILLSPNTGRLSHHVTGQKFHLLLNKFMLFLKRTLECSLVYRNVILRAGLVPGDWQWECCSKIWPILNFRKQFNHNSQSVWEISNHWAYNSSLIIHLSPF